MSETERTVLAIFLVLPWMGATAFNAFFAAGRILARRENGVSSIPVFGSLFGVVALLLAPFWTLAERLILLPLGILPDLIPFIETWIHGRRRRHGVRATEAKSDDPHVDT